MYTALFIGLSPLFVAALRQLDWPSQRVALLALALAFVSYTLGRWCDGALPLDQLATLDLAAYARGFIEAVVGQQALYLLLRQSNVMQWLEQLGGSSPTV